MGSGRLDALEAQLHVIEIAAIENIQQLTTTEARIRQIDDQLATVPMREASSTKSVPDNGADLMRQDFYTNQMRLMDLRSRLPPDHPLMIATERQVEESQQVLDNESDSREESVDDINPVHRDLTLELRRQETLFAGLQAARTKLDSQRQEILDMSERFNRNEIERADITGLPVLASIHENAANQKLLAH